MNATVEPVAVPGQAWEAANEPGGVGLGASAAGQGAVVALPMLQGTKVAAVVAEEPDGVGDHRT